MKNIHIAILVISLLLTACRGTPTPDVEATVLAAIRATELSQPTATPFPTNSPVPTNTPVPTFTPYPTYTPYPTLTSTEIRTATPTATNTRTPTSTPTPSVTPDPTSTLAPTFTPTALLLTNTPIPRTEPATEEPYEDEVPTGVEEFREYLIQKYDSINDQPLTFEEIIVFTEEEYSINSVILRLTSSSADVFGDQTEAAAMRYARALLEDTKKYFGGVECSAYVEEQWYTDLLPDYAIGNEWYYLGDYDVDTGWYVVKEYVRAYYIMGHDSVKVWNYK